MNTNAPAVSYHLVLIGANHILDIQSTVPGGWRVSTLVRMEFLKDDLEVDLKDIEEAAKQWSSLNEEGSKDFWVVRYISEIMRRMGYSNRTLEILDLILEGCETVIQVFDGVQLRNIQGLKQGCPHQFPSSSA